jgi:hypothetical protein
MIEAVEDVLDMVQGFGMYSEWYDTRSDVYGFKYDLAGELWSKDEDGAQKTINRFEKKLNKRVGL